MAAGMNWWQALLTISLGNLLVLVPMLLNAHAGTKYGVPFPVFVRASFGVRGANFAAMARALVACGWFGIQTWLGGLALDALMTAAWGGWANVPGHHVHSLLRLLGDTGRDHSGRHRGREVLRVPLGAATDRGQHRLASLGLLRGRRRKPRCSRPPPKLQQGDAPFWALFWPSLAANVGYWITLSLNIPDFTRYAKTQRSQVLGTGPRSSRSR